MTTFINTKFNISDDQTNIDMCRLAANIIFINKKLDFCGPVSHLRESTISDLESPSNFQVKEKN